MLLILTIIINIKWNFSIYSFIEYLQEKGLYAVLQQIKLHLGNDIAIKMCNTFVETIHCEELVRIFLTNPSPSSRAFHFDDDTDPEKQKEDLLRIINKYYGIISDNLGVSETEHLKTKTGNNKFIY